MGRLFRGWGAALLTVAIILSLYWRVLSRQYTSMDNPDMAHLILPWLQLQAVAWHHGELPLWDPYVWGGQPLLGQMEPGSVYPFNWILFALPLPGGHIQFYLVQLSIVLARVMAGLFAYWLCRDLKLSQTASILGGVAFAAGGIVGWVDWTYMLHGAIWMPLVLLFFQRSVRGERPLANAAFSGTFLGIAFLSGHHQIPMFTGLMMTGLWIAEFVRRRRAMLPAAGVFLAFTGLVSAVQILPGLEYGALALRWVNAKDPVGFGQPVPYPVHQMFSTTPAQILGLALQGQASDGGYMGAAICVLALIALVIAFEKPLIRTMGGIVLGGLLLALGGWSVFQGVLYWLVPMVEKARNPAMAMTIVQFALAILAAMGLDELRVRALGRAWVRGFLIAGALAWAALFVAMPLRQQASREYERWAVFGVILLSAAALVTAWQLRKIPERAMAGFALLLVVFELGTFVGQEYYHRDAPAGFLRQLETNHDLVDFLRKLPDRGRVEVDTGTVEYNIGDWNGIDTMQAFLAGVTTNVMDVGGDPKLWGITHYLGKDPIRPDQQLLFRSAAGVGVYRNPGDYPRVWTVHEGTQLTREQIKIAFPGTDIRKKVLLRDPVPPLETCESPDQARMTGKTLNSVTVSATMSCRGVLIVSETYYPGWTATIDGKPAKVYQADGAVRGVVVDRGQHTIDFQFRPMSVFAGAVLTALGLLGALAIACVPLRRSVK